MLTIGSVQIPFIENLSDSDLQELVGKLFNFARSISPMDSEHEKFDFKEKLDISNKHEVRKDFASFANTQAGLVLVGIKDKTLEIVGIDPDRYPPDEQLRQILSTKTRIRPPVRYSWRTISYEGKKLVLYQIHESDVAVEVYDEKARDWKVYERYGSTIRVMDHVEVMLKWYRGAKRLPRYLQVDIPSLGFYSPDGAKEPSSIKWTVKNQGAIYKWLQLMWTQLVPIPVPTIPFDPYSDFYGATTRWVGNSQELSNILLELENRIQETHGIIYEFWTIPMPEPRTLLEEHCYLTGCGALPLANYTTDISKKQHLSLFGWILFAKSVIYIVSGDISESHCSIDVNPRVAFIPNNFPFVSIDEIGRVVLEPLPVNKVVTPDIRHWKQPIASDLFLEDLEDSQLAILPTLKITGYVGQEPRQRIYDSPFRARGLTVIDMSKGNKALEGAPPMITEVSPLFCHIASAPRGLNDSKETRVVGLECNTLPIPQYPIHDFSIILFNIDCSLNQSKAFKLTFLNEHVA